MRKTIVPSAVGVLALACAAMAAQPALAKKYNVYLSMSYVGNDWQQQASNMANALAQSKDMKDKINFSVQIAGPSAQRQIQQINAMVQAGANAIVIYPISPTALNQAVKNACDKGVVIFAYDSRIEEPCAHNVAVDQVAVGQKTAEWLVDKLAGKGNIVAITGVPGTSASNARWGTAEKVFAANPGIKVLAAVNGSWSEQGARTELSKVLASHSWDQIDGVWAEAGCYTVFSMQKEEGIPDDKLKPCASESNNGHRIQMLPVGTEVDGASGTYVPMGAPSISYGNPPTGAALALKLAVDKLDGKDVPNDVTIPLPIFTSEQIKLCKEGTYAEMAAGCNVFEPALIPNPAWDAQIYLKELPQIGLRAALAGSPEE
jgi:ribose transport system substrate-binding protein